MLIGLFTSPLKTEAASENVKIVLQFTDETQMIWKTGQKKLDTKGKKLAYVYFGNYPQTAVKDESLLSKLCARKYNKYEMTTYNGKKYRREEPGLFADEYSYFLVTPIKWRVLSNSGGEVFLISEYGLDDQLYNDKNVNVTWEKCSLRKWLNGEFLSMAFSKSEKKFIKTKKIKNKGNSENGSKGGNATKDKVFLLSVSDVKNKKYGFKEKGTGYDSRKAFYCGPTEYARAKGALTSDDSSEWGSDTTEDGYYTGFWWLRTPGNTNQDVAFVDLWGNIMERGFNVWEDGGYNYYVSTVRPAMYLNLSSVIK